MHTKRGSMDPQGPIYSWIRPWSLHESLALPQKSSVSDTGMNLVPHWQTGGDSQGFPRNARIVGPKHNWSQLGPVGVQVDILDIFNCSVLTNVEGLFLLKYLPCIDLHDTVSNKYSRYSNCPPNWTVWVHVDVHSKYTQLCLISYIICTSLLSCTILFLFSL